jgi:general secretion pathway protein B
MSYILDALRKADAEREQGRVPGLHSQLHPTAAAPEPTPELEPSVVTASPRPWGIILAAGAVGAAVAAALLWMGRDPVPAPELVVAAPTVDAADTRPTTVSAPPPYPATSLPAVEPTLAPDVALATRPATPSQATKSQEVTTPMTGTQPAPASPNNGPRGAEIQPLSALPDSLRRNLPPLVFGGAMHSDNAASRMLVINNNVYREGAEPAPGLVLEEIRLKSAVFRFQGQRFSVNY